MNEYILFMHDNGSVVSQHPDEQAIDALTTYFARLRAAEAPRGNPVARLLCEVRPSNPTYVECDPGSMEMRPLFRGRYLATSLASDSGTRN